MGLEPMCNIECAGPCGGPSRAVIWKLPWEILSVVEGDDTSRVNRSALIEAHGMIEEVTGIDCKPDGKAARQVQLHTLLTLIRNCGSGSDACGSYYIY